MQAFLASVIVSLIFVLRCLMPAFIIYGISRLLTNLGFLKEPNCLPESPEADADLADIDTGD
jgi:hypothetical protein